MIAAIVALLVMLVMNGSLGCAAAPLETTWIVEARRGRGTPVYDAPGGRVIETLRTPGGARVSPLGFQGDHWQIETAAGLRGWLDATSFPVPALEGHFARDHAIHVATAFPIASATRGAPGTRLAILVDTLLDTAGLQGPEMTRQARSIWALYRPYAGSARSVWITLLAGDLDASRPMRSGDGAVFAHARVMRTLCAYREADAWSAWSELGPCRERPALSQASDLSQGLLDVRDEVGGVLDATRVADQ